MTQRPPVNRRAANWPDRLAAIVEARFNAPFVWGVHDCCMFAADVARELTGGDFMAAYRGRYASEAEAEAFLAEGLEATALRVLAEWGAPEIPPAVAQRGDVALVLWGNQPCLGIVIGARVLAPGQDRLRSVPASAILRAWAI
jgi:hypothetical protein